MSNIRDLQRLRGTKPIQHLGHPILHLQPPISETPTLQIGTHKTLKHTQYPKDSLRQTPSKVIHKRGSSFGTPESLERQTFNLIMHPRLSM